MLAYRLQGRSRTAASESRKAVIALSLDSCKDGDNKMTGFHLKQPWVPAASQEQQNLSFSPFLQWIVNDALRTFLSGNIDTALVFLNIGLSKHK